MTGPAGSDPGESRAAGPGTGESRPTGSGPGESRPEQAAPGQEAAPGREPTPGQPAVLGQKVRPADPSAPRDQVPVDQAATDGQERLAERVVRTGMFGAMTTGDTSGYGGLRVRLAPPLSSPRPYGSYFDEIADHLEAGLERSGTHFGDAVERVVVAYGEMTFHIRRERLPEVALRLRDDPPLAFELCLGVSGVHYPQDAGRELHAVYNLISLTHNRRLRLETAAPDADPRLPSLTVIYPTCNWHERETYDFFGIVFDGHPALTRIEMPDDWKGHPQRKDYPLGGIPVEYRGATVPPPDERRAYQ